MSYRPGLGLAVLIAGLAAAAIGASLKYGDYRNGGDSSVFSPGGILVALGAAAFVIGLQMRRRDM
jgi:F0F1-type ATP synthase membrane subunit c/vacuolar-type H+-ATPase subunit K